jgi:hypothetical protein
MRTSVRAFQRSAQWLRSSRRVGVVSCVGLSVLCLSTVSYVSCLPSSSPDLSNMAAGSLNRDPVDLIFTTHMSERRQVNSSTFNLLYVSSLSSGWREWSEAPRLGLHLH